MIGRRRPARLPAHDTGRDPGPRVDAPDVVFVTGDAYVDHPSFAMAILARRISMERANSSADRSKSPRSRRA